MKILATALIFLSLVSSASAFSYLVPLTVTAPHIEAADTPPFEEVQRAAPPNYLSSSTKPVVIENDPGGMPADYLRWLSRLDEVGVPLVVRGECISACTLILSYSNFCVESSASFGFHSAFNALTEEPMINYSKKLAYQFYPPVVRKWFLENVLPKAPLKGNQEPIYLSAEELVKMGAAHYCA